MHSSATCSVSGLWYTDVEHPLQILLQRYSLQNLQESTALLVAKMPEQTTIAPSLLIACAHIVHAYAEPQAACELPLQHHLEWKPITNTHHQLSPLNPNSPPPPSHPPTPAWPQSPTPTPTPTPCPPPSGTLPPSSQQPGPTQPAATTPACVPP